MQNTAFLGQREAWKDRLRALKDLPEVWRYLWHAAPVPVASTLILRLLGGLSPLGMLFAAKQIIDILADPARGNLWPWLAIECTIAAISHVIGRSVDYFDSIIADRFSSSLAQKIMHHAASLDLVSFENPVFQDRLARARAQSTDRVSMLTSAGWLSQRLVMLISLAGGIIYYSPWLFIVLICTVIPAFLVESHFAFLSYTLAHELTSARRLLEYLLTMGSSRDSAKEVKMFGLAGHLRSQYADLSDGAIERNRRLAARRLRWGAVTAVLATSGYYGSYAYLAHEALLRHISLGTFSFLAGAISGANGHLQMIFSLFSGIADQALYLRDLVLFFRERPVLHVPNPGLLPPRPIRTGIQFENVAFRYPGMERNVVEGLWLRLEPGERVALVGENGEGKTTLVKLITRLYDPTEGRILLDGKDLREYNIEELRKEIGVIFQDFVRYDLSARENIAAGNILRLRDDEALWEASKKSNAFDMVTNLPKGLNQMLGTRFEGGVDLSGGQWQRMALARAYLRDAQLLILDEPTAALDPAAEYEVFQKFADLTRDRMALFISHRFSTVRMADRIILLSQGRIVEDGTHEELLATDGLYSRLFNIQASSYR